MFEVIVLILSILSPIIATVLIGSLWLLQSTIKESVDPTYKLKEIPKSDRFFIQQLFKNVGVMRDAERYCEVNEAGIFTELSKDDMTDKLYWYRQIKFFLTAVVACFVTAYLFESTAISFSIMAVLFYASVVDKLLVKVMMNNLLLLKE